MGGIETAEVGDRWEAGGWAAEEISRRLPKWAWHTTKIGVAHHQCPLQPLFKSFFPH